MAKVFSDKIIVAIDIGTTKICVLVARHFEHQAVEILGIGHAPSEGLRKGVVVDISKTIHSIKQAVYEAQLMAGIAIESAHIGVSGGHIHSLNSHGVVPVNSGEVRPFDITNVLAAARAVPIQEGQQILHVLPQYFVIDSQEKVQDPLGMFGIRLEVQAHIITGSIASVQNLIKCCEMAGVKVEDIILEQLASADAVLSDDERELGVGMIDIGGGTSDVALYQHGNIRHTMVLPVAGNHFTQDVAVGVHTNLKEAERIKKDFGYAWEPLIQEDDFFEVITLENNQRNLVSLKDLNQIIQPRAEEIFSLIHEEIVKRNLQPFIATGLVLTGGGSLLKGMNELATYIFNAPVRVGKPRYAYPIPEILNSPMFATAYGLLITATKKDLTIMDYANEPLVKRVFIRMKSWVSDFF